MTSPQPSWAAARLNAARTKSSIVCDGQFQSVLEMAVEEVRAEAMSEMRGVVTNLNVAVKSVQDGTARLPEITGAVAEEAKALPGLVAQTPKGFSR